MVLYPISFPKLQPPKSPNYYLVCPPGVCQDTHPESPQFNVNAVQLQQICETMIAKQPRVKQLHLCNNHMVYIQRSKFWRFPDYIDIEILPIDDTHATLAMYSRSRYGYYDFKVNQQRVKDWLKQMAELVKVNQHRPNC